MKKHLFLFSLLIFTKISIAQVAVNNSGASANPTAILDVSSTTKGFLPPRMNTAQRDAIVAPVVGLSIYNNTIKAYEIYNGTDWYSTVHYIGENYGGGIVFFVYDNGQHGLIAAMADQSIGIRWYGGTITHTRAKADGVGAGLKNTSVIIANQEEDGNTFAARVCNEYSVTADGVKYGDWYLPSLFELNLLYLKSGVVGGFDNSTYWSSTERDDAMTYEINFNFGNQSYSGKHNSYRVRAIRAF